MKRETKAIAEMLVLKAWLDRREMLVLKAREERMEALAAFPRMS